MEQTQCSLVLSWGEPGSDSRLGGMGGSWGAGGNGGALLGAAHGAALLGTEAATVLKDCWANCKVLGVPQTLRIWSLLSLVSC